MKTVKKKMPELMYRASRYFRVLGNPTAYMIIRSLSNGRKTPTELSRELGRALPTISLTLKNLRQVNLVRYETNKRRTEYWVKHPDILSILDSSEKLASIMKTIKD